MTASSWPSSASTAKTRATFSASPPCRECHIKTICDVDERTWPSRPFAERCGVGKVGFEADFRRVLDDCEIDAVSIAMFNY
jgi:hypothetical protein